MIRDHSNSTAVTFMYLPPPPHISMNFKTKCVNYLVRKTFYCDLKFTNLIYLGSFE